MKTITIRTSKRIIKNCVYMCINEETNESFLVDPSWNLDKILDESRQNNCTINALLITHSHFDHINLIEEITNLYDIPVYVSATEAADFNFSCPNMVLFDDNDILDICSMKVRTLLTPGHTTGSSCFLCGDSLFCGDTILIEGCTFVDEEGGDVSALYKSVTRLREIIPDTCRIYPGHANHSEPGVTMRDMKSSNKYIQADELLVFEGLMDVKNILALVERR
ncbi:MAG: MBL fold metallo-hydrolase [Oscillospiraceae bacterium]|nr:MBL fold metallo-hydrolase [Oscillospiraceae bacterium]